MAIVHNDSYLVTFLRFESISLQIFQSGFNISNTINVMGVELSELLSGLTG